MNANPAPGAPSASLYKPFVSKQELAVAIRDLPGADPSLKQDLLLKLSATLTSVWPDPNFVSS